MRKTRAFTVKSSELFKSGKWSVKAAMENPNIVKRCCVCGSVLITATIYEHGEEDDALYCLNCDIFEIQKGGITLEDKRKGDDKCIY